MTNCEYIYDPVKGDKKSHMAPGTLFEDLPDDWRCPLCGASQNTFKNLTEHSGIRRGTIASLTVLKETCNVYLTY